MADTFDDFLAGLPPERRDAISARNSTSGTSAAPTT